VRLANFILLVCVALCAVPCFGSGKKAKAIQTSEVSSSNLVFIGVSGKLSKYDESIQIALEDAARKLSFFYSVNGYSVKREFLGTGAFDISIKSSYWLSSDEDLDKYIEQLEYDKDKDVFISNNAVFITTRFKSNVSMPAFRGIAKDRPSWIDSPPEKIAGFTVGVGFSGRYDSHRDTVVLSYESAIMSIIEALNSSVSGDGDSYQNNYSAFGFDMSTTGEIYSSGNLLNFYIIETWTNPKTLEVWTLAVAAKGL